MTKARSGSRRKYNRRCKIPSVGGVSIGDVFRELREGRSLTKRQAAPSLGIPPAYLSYVESGLCTPSIDLIEAAEAFYGVNPYIELKTRNHNDRKA